MDKAWAAAKLFLFDSHQRWYGDSSDLHVIDSDVYLLLNLWRDVVWTDRTIASFMGEGESDQADLDWACEPLVSLDYRRSWLVQDALANLLMVNARLVIARKRYV